MKKWKTCQDIIDEFNLGVTHCDSCHYELDEGYQDPQPIIINKIIYDTPCCSVAEALRQKHIEFDYL